MIPLITIIAIATALSVPAIFLADKIVEFFSIVNRVVKFAAKALGSAIATSVTAFFGWEAIVGILSLFENAPDLPEAPQIPPDFGLLNWLLVYIVVFALSATGIEVVKRLKK